MRRWLIAVVVAAGMAAVYVMVLRLFVDPRPVGRLQFEQQLSVVGFDSYSQQEVWVDEVIPAAEYTVQLTAAYLEGEQDVVYGLALGEQDEYLRFTVSPLGYAAVHQVIGGEVVALRPLAPFPHVRTGAERNEWWVTVEDAQLIVRLNREIFWVGEPAIDTPKVMLTAESFGADGRIAFEQLTIFYE